MLNCCIERKVKREQLFKGYTGKTDNDESPQSDIIDSGCQSSDKKTSSKEKNTDCDVEERKSALEQKGKCNNSSHNESGESRTDSENKSEEIPAKIAHLDTSSDDEEFFECEDKNMEISDAEEVNLVLCVFMPLAW